MILEAIQYIFSGFWTFIGTAALLSCIGSGRSSCNCNCKHEEKEVEDSKTTDEKHDWR